MGGFKRGKKKGLGIVKPTPAKNKDLGDMPINLQEAGESAKDLENLPIEVEQIKYLQRQAKNSGLDVKEEKLAKEQAARDEYNSAVVAGDPTSLYSKITPPAGSVILKIFKKPIFELNGFLKPDLVKKENPKTGGSYYVENRFPYLDCGVVVTENGLTKQFGEIEGDWQGALITLKPKVRLDNYVYFIDKTDITPTYFEGHICIPSYEIESVVATKGNEFYEEMVEKMLGKSGNQTLQAKLNAEAEEELANQETDTNNEEDENA